MSVRYFPVKSVILKGSINTQVRKDIVYRLCPINEFSVGIWNLSILSLSYSVKPLTIEIKDIFSVSCNFVKGQKLSLTHQVETYEEPLSMFLFKNVQNKTSKNIIYFEKQWFHMNTLSNELKFTLKNEDNLNFNYESEIILQVLFQRVL